MNTYLVVKWVHVLSSVVLVGTGFGTAYFFAFANRSRNVQAQAVVARLVVRADACFTTPAVIVQPLTGVMLASMAGWPPHNTVARAIDRPVPSRRCLLAARAVVAVEDGRDGARRSG